MLLGKTNKSDLGDIRDEIKKIRKNLNRGKVYRFPIKIIEKSLIELRKEKTISKNKITKKKRVAKKRRKSSSGFFDDLTWGF